MTVGNCGGCAQRAEAREQARREALAANAGTYNAMAAAASPLWEAETADGTTRRFGSAAAARIFVGPNGTVRRVT
jgi:hypothetical protein